jgi:hypothetical protein
MLSNNEKDDWQFYLPWLLFAYYRTMYQQTTRHTPFMMPYEKEVATNNEDFKILKDMVDFYLRYKQIRNTMQMQSNYITVNGFFSRD